MPEGHLHAVVDAIAAAGSQQLARRAAEGAPVPFDLVEVPSSGGGAPLFSYRPRTRDFVEEHVDALRQLMAWTSAVNVLAGFDGMGDYLLTHGERHVPIDARERADLTLRVLLASMHEETGDFIHTPARAGAAGDALARCLLAGRVEGTVVVPLLGVRLEAERVEIESGLVLVRDDTIEGLPREARSPVRGRPGTVVVVKSLEDPAHAAALAQARPRLRALLTALRLYDEPAPALAPVAWSRVRGDGWASHPFIGTCARASGTLVIAAEHAEAIRGFCSLMAKHQPGGGPSAWALRRFELACERADHGEALTDALLGLRALLEADQPGSGALADRLAALCAAPDDWDAMRDRVQIAEALEINLMQGRAVDASRTRALSLELRGHLRAVLRDMACGHLPADLVELAEQHLSSEDPQGVPGEAPGRAPGGPQVVITDTRGLPGPVEVIRAEQPVQPEHAGEPTATYEAAEYPPADDSMQAPAAAVHTPPEDPSAYDPSLYDLSEPMGPDEEPYDEHAPATGAHLGVAAPAEPIAVGAVAPQQAGELGELGVPIVLDPISDPRSITETGERFEDAFVRSLSEGPSERRRARPGRGRWRAR